jgi:hypothetical protein
MTSAGFFRIEGYGLEARHQAGKKAMPWRTIAGIAAEAARKVGAAAHVKGNVAVECLLGEDPMVLAQFAMDQARHARNQGKVKPGRLSPSASSFFAAVASFPESSRQRSDDTNFIERYHDWRERLIAWILKRWGEFRISVIEHRDEEYWHVHILIAPPMDDQGRLLVGLIHPGYAARGDLERAGLSSASANIAYKAAMRDLLDEYCSEVGASSGHARKSNKPRQRFSRVQVVVDRRQRERELDLREQERDLIVAQDGLRRWELAVTAQINALSTTERNLITKRHAIDSQRQQLLQVAETLQGSFALERQRFASAQAGAQAKVKQAAELVRIASEENLNEHKRLVAARRVAMTSDAVRLADENLLLRAQLAEAQRKLAAVQVEDEQVHTEAGFQRAG